MGFEVVHRDAFAYCAHPVNTTVAERNLRIPEAFRATDKSLAEVGAVERRLMLVRYRRTSSDGTLEVEGGWMLPAPVTVPKPEISGTTLAGLYAVGRLDGLYSGLEAKAQEILEWGDERGLAFDVERGSDGDRWGCRYDLHLTEPEFGPGGQRGPVSVCIRLRD